MKTYLDVLPRELRQELDKYFMFTKISIIIEEEYYNEKIEERDDALAAGEEWEGINDNDDIEFLLSLPGFESKPFVFAFKTTIRQLKIFVSKTPDTDYYYGFSDSLTDITLDRVYGKHKWKINVSINSPDRSFIIHVMTPMEHDIVLSKFQLLVNDIDNKLLRQYYLTI